MNNPLVQKAQYYLNEAHRLNEELKNETEYSELLENILVELIGEEAFYGLFEDLQTKERARQVQKIIKARAETAKKHDDDAADSAFYDTDDNESRVARAAHSERLLSQAKNRDAREKASKRTYGVGGKVVKEDSVFEDLQTPERKKEMSNLKRAAKRKADKDSAEAYREGEMGSAESADAAHDTAADSAYRQIVLSRKDAKERASKKLYGKGGRIVK